MFLVFKRLEEPRAFTNLLDKSFRVPYRKDSYKEPRNARLNRWTCRYYPM